MLCPLPFFRRHTRLLLGLLVIFNREAQAAVDPGEILISEMNCVACHETTAPIQARLASRPSPRLDAAHAVRVNPPWLRAFLENPQAVQPGTLMPDLLAGLEPGARAEAAEALTHYLVELRGVGKAVSIEVSAETIPTGKALYHTIGCVACHAPEEPPSRKTDGPVGPAELEKLRLTSVPLGALREKYPLAELAAFLTDPLKSRPGGRMPSFKLTPAEAHALAAYLLRAPAPEQAPSIETFAVDPAKSARGKELFSSMNCAACHPIDILGRQSKPLAMLNGRQPTGCLGTKPKTGVPRFALTDRQRVVILAQLGNQAALAEPLTPEQQITRTMTALNCYSCHARERRGGVDIARREYFTTTDGTDLGDEGRLPPTLRGVGVRLRPDALKAALLEGIVIRSQMATRMPLYGPENVWHLPALFEQADHAKASTSPDISTPGGSNGAGKK
jgi:mono/diheme cytochrome c family protein